MRRGSTLLLSLLLFSIVPSCGKGETRHAATTDAGTAPDDGALSRRLDEVERLIAEGEARAARAKDEAQYFECKSSVERVKAEIQADTAACLKQLADQAACAAREEREKGDSMLVGCLLGLGFAYVTAGAAAPYALGGCAAGRVSGEAASDPCPVPACAAELPVIHEPRLRAAGWSEFPQCGGWLGIDVETPNLTLIGGLRVKDLGVLGAAGVNVGDFLAYADSKRIKTVAELRSAVTAGIGENVELRFVHQGKMYVGNVPRPRSLEALGAEFEMADRAEHARGARITQLREGSPLAKNSEQGLDVLSLDGTDVANREHLRDLLRYRRSGEKLKLVVGDRKRGTSTAFEAVLSPRNGRSEL